MKQQLSIIIYCSLHAAEAADTKARQALAESRLLLAQFTINDLRLGIQSRGKRTCFQ